VRSWGGLGDDDGQMLSAFVAARSQALLRTAYLLTGDERAADDLFQSALLRTLQHWRRIRDYEALEGFVRQVMVNELRSWHRRKASREVVSSVVTDRLAPAYESADLGQTDLIQRALLALPPRQRATIVLRYFEDLPEAEVARVLECSVGTVKSQTNKGLANLRAAFRQLEPEEQTS
jgi:RNA polymerase sigma-70 factor (sigma-E family)